MPQWLYCLMLTVSVALILIQKDIDQEDDLFETVELRKTGKSKQNRSLLSQRVKNWFATCIKT